MNYEDVLVEYAKYFEKAGYKVTPIKDTKDLIAIKRGYKKQDFLNSKAWKYMSENDKRLLFLGLYAADGKVGGNKLCTTDNRIAEFIKTNRKAAGLTQEEFAIRSGLGLRFVRELEQGKPTVRMDKVNIALAMFDMEAVPGRKENK